jgi:hypothetical protein
MNPAEDSVGLCLPKKKMPRGDLPNDTALLKTVMTFCACENDEFSTRKPRQSQSWLHGSLPLFSEGDTLGERRPE